MNILVTTGREVAEQRNPIALPVIYEALAIRQTATTSSDSTMTY
jgi:hypothetical protein